ncbi:hypothetical protein EO95_10700 [Methanosarcina sp. 1.H.T.1A.1]|uniref:tetratricopeptide repeat protein n=1 Tax=Methanosarcina sp. 1.H.T.1A.1 TaxID=1483602 RepID=UPI00062190D5|nr:tetratricopeptide repeat protein [Methanosarcina sp. 1.H.T.1A.1]KKH97241.1 hypothetical protein EO95_10700 [Methanosarcina sp. 1.H.T.1A.1]
MKDFKIKAEALLYKGSALYERGLQLEKIQNFEEAHQKFTETKKIFQEFKSDPSLIESLENELKSFYYYKKGLFCYHIKYYNTAIDTFSKALKLKETKGKVFFQLSLAYYKIENFENSAKYFKEAINSSYYDKEILAQVVEKLSNTFEKGLFYYTLKKYDDAIQVFDKVKNHDEEEAFYKALSQYELKEFKKSLKQFGSLIDKDSEIAAKSCYYKGLILHELRNNFKDQELLKAVFDGYDTVSIGENEKIELKEESQKFVNNKEGKNLKEYISWDVGKKTKFVKYLNDPSNNEPKAEEILQRIIDIESQTAFEEALNKYNEIIESSQTFGLYYDKALVLDELKRYKEAIESLDEFLKNKPRDAKAWLKKGTILFKIAKDEGIKTTFEEPKTETETEKISCEKEITRIKAAKDALKKSSWHFKIDEAIETTSEEPKTETGNEKISCEKEITRIEAAKNALEKSIGYFKILIDENPKNPDHWYNRGTAHSSLAEVFIKTRDYQDALKEYEEAVKAFDNATTLNPNFALAWNNKGNAYMKLKKYNKAIEAFEEAFKINSNYYLALHNKGDALYSLGKYDEAIRIYNQVIYEDETQKKERESDPNIYKSWNDKGLALYKLERYDEAVKAFDKALDINPTFADGYINKGLVFYKLEMLSGARTAFEEALKIEPGNARASNNLGVVLARDGELDRAKKLFENTFQENPDFILAHANLAELLLNSGGIEEASKNIKIISIDDKNPDPNMGYIHFLDGRIKIENMESKEKKYSEAAKSFEKATSFNVDNPIFLLWSVYAKYLCQKFETGGKANSSEKQDSSEKQNSEKEDVSPKAEDICSNELSNSIVSDLGKVLNFCNAPVIKKDSLQKLLDQKLLWKITVAIIFLYGLIYLFKFLGSNIQNIFSIQILNNLELIAIGLILLFVLFDRKLIWPIIIILISLFGPFYLFDSNIWIALILIIIALVTLPRLLDRKLLWPMIKVIVLLLLFYSLSIKTILVLLLLILLYELIFGLIQKPDPFSKLIDWLLSLKENILEIKIKEHLIRFDRYKEIKAYTLYLQGYFYFKLQDYTTAKEKLKECINLRPDTRTDKASRELLDNIWKHKIKPPFWTYWFNSPVNTWRRRTFGIFVILGILLILFVHTENPQPVAWNESTSNDSRNFIPGQINIYPYIISYYPANNTTSNLTGSSSNYNNANDENENDNNNINNNVTWNILTPEKVNIYPDIPDNYFDAILLLILILILISPSVRITENVKLILKKGGDVSLDLGPIAAPPEFNFELSPSLMLDVIKRLDENL